MMGVRLRYIRKEYAIICDGCKKMETVVAQDRDCAIGHFRQQGWKMGRHEGRMPRMSEEGGRMKWKCPKCGMLIYIDRITACPHCFVKLEEIA